MAIDPVMSVSFEALRGLSLADAARDGRILEARVTAMLTDTLARLSIGGQDIDVTTPQRLPVGAQLTLRAERDGGQLKLITQAPIAMPPDSADAAPASAAAARPLPDILIEPGKALLARVQAIAVEAMLADTPVADKPPAPAPARPEQGAAAHPAGPPEKNAGGAAIMASMRAVEALLRGDPTGDAGLRQAAPRSQPPPGAQMPMFPSARQDFPEQPVADAGRSAAMRAVEALLGDVPAEETPSAQASLRSPPPRPDAPPPPNAALQPPDKAETAPLASSFPADAVRPEAEARRDATSEALRAYTSPEVSASPAQTNRQAQFSIDIPLFFPGSPEPLRLQVTRDDGEDEDDQTGEIRPRSWTVRFAAEAGSLGMIHAAISLVGERVGVQLWAEKSDTAATFREDVARLQDALEASNLTLDALKIAQGQPPADSANESSSR
jgi:hypothetical protein